MFKYILKEASPQALVHFINGLFDTQYSVESPVRFAATESVQQEAEHLETISSDMILRVGDEAFHMETQISDDQNIALRVFQYGFAYARQGKVIEADESITMKLPAARVLYWETSGKTPDRVKLRIIFPDKSEHSYEIATFKMLEQGIEGLEARHLVLLAPFYLLKYRKALMRGNMTREKRREVAGEVKGLLRELEGLVEREEERGIISRGDAAGLFEHLIKMYREVYPYPEFEEAAMELEERVKTHWREYLHRGIQQGEKRILMLLKQGYTVEQVENLLAQERDQDRSDALNPPGSSAVREPET